MANKFIGLTKTFFRFNQKPLITLVCGICGETCEHLVDTLCCQNSKEFCLNCFEKITHKDTNGSENQKPKINCQFCKKLIDSAKIYPENWLLQRKLNSLFDLRRPSFDSSKKSDFQQSYRMFSED